jgi:hypothetical protein
VKTTRILIGLAMGILVLGLLWFGGILTPPETLSRAVAVLSAVYPGPMGEAQIERIPCPPLAKLRFYVVCTRDCEEIWRIVAVKGLQPQVLTDLARIPPEPEGLARRRLNTAVGREALRLDDEGVREMIGCHLRLDGRYPELILPEGGLQDVESARPDEDAMRRLAARLDQPGALSRIRVQEVPTGFDSRFLYWDTFDSRRPVLEIWFQLARDGQLRQVRVRTVPRRDDAG